MNDPTLELIALHIEREAMGWLTAPEQIHPNRGAIERGQFGTRDQRIGAIQDDGKEVADYLMELADEVRAGNRQKALSHLRMQASRDEEARELLHALDPTIKPWHPYADANGDPVIVGNKYRWTPDSDNRGNPPGYYCEGVVTRLPFQGAAFAVWLRIGEANPTCWDGRGEDSSDPLQETWVFTTMLSPVGN